MNRWEYNFGVPLAQSLQSKLDALGLIAQEHPTSRTPDFEKNAFTPDGYPVSLAPNIIYPSLLYRTIGIPVSENLINIDPCFRQQAALAALKWAEKVYAKQSLNWAFHGIYLNETIQGQDIRFCFPVTSMVVNINNNLYHCAVLAFPESHHDEDNWKDGMIPQYAQMQAQLTLWCSQQYAATHDPDYCPMDSAILVRISGNLSVDNMIRTVNYDPQQAQRILQRVSRAVTKCKSEGIGYHDNLVALPAKDWKEEKQMDLEDAYCIDSEDFHALIQQYMAARSSRKRLEEQDEALKKQMDNIAINLMSKLDHQHEKGTLEINGTVYSVAHKRKTTRGTSISADLVRQLAPLYSDAIHTNVIPRGRITIEVL